jgi:hypothetical protein
MSALLLILPIIAYAFWGAWLVRAMEREHDRQEGRVWEA